MCFYENGDTDMEVHWFDRQQRQHFIDHVESGKTVEEWLALGEKVRRPFITIPRQVGVLHEMARLAPANVAARRREEEELAQANKDLATLRALFTWDAVEPEVITVEPQIAVLPTKVQFTKASKYEMEGVADAWSRRVR